LVLLLAPLLLLLAPAAAWLASQATVQDSRLQPEASRNSSLQQVGSTHQQGQKQTSAPSQDLSL
jgi:hypothetical protein